MRTRSQRTLTTGQRTPSGEAIATSSPGPLIRLRLCTVLRVADDYVFRLCSLFAKQPAFSDTLVKTLALAREQADILNAYAQKAGHQGHLGDAFQGFKMR